MQTKNQLPPSPLNGRLLSLDAFRGLTIAGMIIVNDPGSWSHVYAPLRHADWHGITPTDMVFPFFLFIVGISITLAYTKRLASDAPRGALIQKIFKRAAIIFALGLFLALFPKFNFGNLRIPGVLQRIAIVFLICALLFLNTNWKQQAWIGGILLVGYWAMMSFLPIPIDDVIQQALLSGEVLSSSGNIPIQIPTALSESYIAANYEPGTNLQAWMDRQFIPGRIYQKTWDPEGLLSTLPSIATGICGMLVGKIWTSSISVDRKVIWIFVFGFLAYLLGSMWNWIFPINKNLWTSSFVLYTAGLGAMTFAASIWIVDIQGYKKWTKVGLIFGANAITAYVIHGMIWRLFNIPFGEYSGLQSFFFTSFVDIGLAPNFVSLLWALLYTTICFIPVYILYQRKIFIKV